MSDDDDPMPDVGSSDQAPPSATLLWDRQNCVPLQRCLAKDDLILLLSPVVVPPNSQSIAEGDPFEPLGQTLAERHPMVRHVPYTKNKGITGVHVAFIKKADVVVFVITGFKSGEEVSQTDLAELTGEACESRPLIVIFCCDIDEETAQKFDFPTVIRATGFSTSDLSAISGLLLDGESPSNRSTTEPPQSAHGRADSWSVQRWDYHGDLETLHSLWNESMPRKFHLDKAVLGSLLRREEDTVHHVARDSASGEVIGLCASYITYADRSGERLVGSVAALLVKEEFRGRGIGRALHDEALGSLSKTRGIRCLQLGSTFPRLLYGIPSDHPGKDWFQTRGWQFDQSGPGKGRVMADWVLDFSKLPTVTMASAGMKFRSCELSDVPAVWEMVGRDSERKTNFGSYDQYTRTLDNDEYMGHVILGFEGTTMVATAITYTPDDGSPTAQDVPWASSIGPDIGGVSCICIKDDDPEMINRRDTVMVRLLYACCISLRDRGMKGAFLDGLKSNEAGVETLGFRQWAQYREVWHPL